MTFRRPPAVIRPKISTMPRYKTEASCQLELYKLVTEKQRLEHELNLVEQRAFQINKRLEVINNHITEVEKKVIEMRENSQPPKLTTRIPTSDQKQ
ncbi:MAG TPA: hypothetical protein V6C58_12770, partial [Allocoleopsis sp.]